MNTQSSSQQFEYVSTREAAEILGVALRTVQLWVENGNLTAWKTAGGHRKVSRSSINAVLAQRRQSLGLGVGKNSARMTVEPVMLVVEDDDDLLRLYELHIEGWGLPLRLLTARNGFEGMLKLGEHHPHILITDLNMPGIDGFRMLRNFSAWPQFRDMLTIVVTALAPGDVADRGGLPDGVLLLTKPAPFGQLEALIRKRIAYLLTLGSTEPASFARGD